MWGYVENRFNIQRRITIHLRKIVRKKQHLQSSRPLPNIALNKIRESLSIEWTYNSNSIEGNTMSLRETQMVLQEGITVKENRFGSILKPIIMIKLLIICILSLTKITL